MVADVESWQPADEFETIVHANKPFSLRVPALIVTMGRDGVANIMLSMWYTPMGVEPSCFLVAVDPTTKTHALMHETNEFVIAAPDERLFDVALYAGTVSGHDENKWAGCGLTPVRPSAGNVPLVGEALANVELSVLRTLEFDGKYDLVVGQVKVCHVKKEYFHKGIYKENARPLLWLGKESGAVSGDKSASYFAAGLGRIWKYENDSPEGKIVPRQGSR